METSSKKRLATINDDNHSSNLMNHTKKKKKTSLSSSLNINESPIAGTRITEWEEYEKWKEIRGDIEPTMNYVEITPEAIEELRKIKNIIGDYICQLCKVKYENAFALAMHKCPRVVHIEFRCPECDKTFNCPANLASHRRWHKPQTSLSSNETAKQTPSSSSSSTQKSITNKHPRCSSRSDSRSTNTSSSIVSDTVHEYASLSASSPNMDVRKKDSIISNGTHKKSPDEILRTMYNGNSQWMVPSSFQPFTTSHMKPPLIFRHHRSLPMSIPSSFDFRRLQSLCIFCHEQFSDLNHLLQHIRKNHAVTSSTNTKNTTLTLDKIVF
ncbi:unnamed protein product [Rotaria sordida]|uniref:C2H2-type domain-containing protein n=1 Tax=Rotaria sordida TaxID=392033 RepID=A0A814XZB7_9BILA|nr:unnamed protein product [Rotaria sordida]CAF1091389.1 unnamed protein product [Rotaria sordida]CAF1094275.1 unnamed protein product [Rotaria sordida]CAF1142672.1 unnamed protein product [Rotaria sordida]CAF1194452.1 unnamed protein product [Rotaria sordida]